MAKLPRANKELGQHFLKDKSVIEKIVNDSPESYDAIVEVGPGPGALTGRLSEIGKPLYLIEMDRRFEEGLQLPNVKEIFFQDAMKFDWSRFLENEGLQGKKIWMVSNLPYNVSSQLFVQFTKVEEISKMTLMYQKEVGEKTYLRQGVKNQANSLLVLSQTYLDSKLLVKVSPGAFLPPPKVDSVVVSYMRKASPEIELEKISDLESFLRKLFALKRKQIGSVLKSWPNGKKFLETLKSNNFDTTLRSESLDIETTQNLYKLYASQCSITK